MLKTWKDRLYLVALAAAAVVGVVGWLQWFDDDPMHHNDSGVTLTIPELTAEAAMGQALFEENCMTCHGRHATGSEQGPPLVHRIYEPITTATWRSGSRRGRAFAPITGTSATCRPWRGSRTMT